MKTADHIIHYDLPDDIETFSFRHIVFTQSHCKLPVNFSNFNFYRIGTSCESFRIFILSFSDNWFNGHKGDQQEETTTTTTNHTIVNNILCTRNELRETGCVDIEFAISQMHAECNVKAAIPILREFNTNFDRNFLRF